MFKGHYKKYERSPATIDLDFKNPRLRGYVRRESLTTQKDIVRALVQRYDVISLCKAIVKNGFHPDETLIVIPDEAGSPRKVTVIEGNRRLCACKVLIKPNLLKGTPYFAAMNRLVRDRNYADAIASIRKLSVVELPGRKDAAAYLASKHTQESIKGWSPYTQGAYLLEFKTKDMSLSDLKDLLNSSMDLAKIRHRVLFFQLSEYILNMECWSEEEALALMDNIDNIRTEAIIRLINSSKFRNEVGNISIDDRGNLFYSSLDTASFEAVMEKLARDTNFNEHPEGSGKFVLTTRQENNEKVAEYIMECAEMADANQERDPDGSRTYVSPQEDDDQTIPDGDETEEVEKKAPRKPRNNWVRLLPQDIALPANPKLRTMVEEAIKLNTKGFKYTAALLSRALIEITLKIQIKERGLENTLRAQYHEKSFNFENLLSFTEQNISVLVDDEDSKRAIRNAIQGLLQRDKEILNLTNHNDMAILSNQELDHIMKKLFTVTTYFFSKMQRP